jgi:hypothetical protein
MIVIDRCITKECDFIQISKLPKNITTNTTRGNRLFILCPLIFEGVDNIIIEFTTFARSYGSISHEDFVTMNETNSSRSNVVKRAPHFSHSRRRRIAFPSSVVRESITRVSRFRHLGHFIDKKVKDYWTVTF